MLAKNVGATSRTPVTVVIRETLWDGGTAKVTIPKVTKAGECVGVKYLQFAQNVKGGVVNFFVNINHEDGNLSGTTITAIVQIKTKVLADGRSFLYVDLVPVHHHEAPTHRLSVMSEKPVIADNWVVFETMEPLKGYVVLTPPDAKLIKSEHDSKSVSDDPHLDRLLKAGWEVESSHDLYVKLVRQTQYGPKQMIHRRPKK